MFNLNDYIGFSLQCYKENGEPINYSKSFPKGIDMSFKLPEETSYVEIKEYTEFSGIPSITTILTLYIGKEEKMKKVLENAEEVTLNDGLDLQRKDAFDLRLLVHYKDKKAQIIKVLNNNEKAFSSLEQMEKFIRVFSTNIAAFIKKSDDIKKLIKLNE